ncbi:hypothetical protein BN59_03424 [Legionella massiliensis]|uniref:Secreted protein n=1 Tax=Legionella massiliensis TaxID=1034943 RepID=A0A078L1H9_9GAMM|nr:hypothetical protein [Legionella massiliensis]CDZ79107.1 hypothetical protein BN59_03424 [Legionella massiliensis]CEE14845.1 hypothetical protein BN1094_03424 [Legionella massiliensis]
MSIQGIDKLILKIIVCLAVLLASLAQANSIPQHTGATSKTIDLAYFRVYRVQPGWWYGPYLFPGRVYNHSCSKSCVYNRYGAVIRCTRTCYY